MVICCKFKKNLSNFIHIFSWFNKCIYPQLRGRQPQLTKFDVNRNLLTLRSFATSLKKYLWSLILYIFFMILYMYIAPGQGLTTHWGFFMSTGTCCHFGHLLQVSKKSLWSLILYIFVFIILHMHHGNSSVWNWPLQTPTYIVKRGFVGIK